MDVVESAETLVPQGFTYQIIHDTDISQQWGGGGCFVPEHEEGVGVALGQLRTRVPVLAAPDSHLSRLRRRVLLQRSPGSRPGLPVRRRTKGMAAGSRSHVEVRALVCTLYLF